MEEAVQKLQNHSGNLSENPENPTQTGPDQVTSENSPDTIQVNWDSRVESEIHLSQIARTIEQVVWLRDTSGRILYVNPAFETVWGRPIASLYADPNILIESVHPEDRVQVMVARPRSDRKPFNQAYRILRPDGSQRWIFAQTTLLHNGNEEANYLFCIAQDITDQKQVELALRRTLDRSREQFDLSRKMSLARKPETVLKAVMSAHELRSAKRAALLFFDNPGVGPARGVELTAVWLSSQTLPPG